MRSPKWIIVVYVVLFVFMAAIEFNMSDSTAEGLVWSAIVGVILAFGAWLSIRRLHKTDAGQVR